MIWRLPAIIPEFAKWREERYLEGRARFLKRQLSLPVMPVGIGGRIRSSLFNQIVIRRIRDRVG